jgi:hypothetical protein
MPKPTKSAKPSKPQKPAKPLWSTLSKLAKVEKIKALLKGRMAKLKASGMVTKHGFKPPSKLKAKR